MAFWHKELDKPRNTSSDQMMGSYLGPKFNNQEVENTLKSLNAKFTKLSDEELVEITA